MLDPSKYDEILVGQEVEFEEEPDLANGTRAVRVRSRLLPVDSQR
jgi:hypothetical protein